MALAIAWVISQSSIAPVREAMTLRTGWMRRSALVKVPFFSRKVEPGRKTWAIVRRLVEEEIVDDHAFHRRKPLAT